MYHVSPLVLQRSSDDIPEKVNVLEGGPAVPKSGVLCTSLDLVKEGKKEMLVQRIVVYFLSNPSELDAYPHFKDLTVLKDTSQKWKTAKSHYELEAQFHKELLQEEGFDPTVYFDSSKTLRVSFLKLCLLGKERQKFSPCFPDGKAAYINCFGVKYDVAHIERHLKETTDSQLSRWTVADGGKKTSSDINVRAPDCLFRLINILMLDDEVYGCLLAESKSQQIDEVWTRERKEIPLFGTTFRKCFRTTNMILKIFLQGTIFSLSLLRQMASYLIYPIVNQNGLQLTS